jgi:hypothetical protein
MAEKITIVDCVAVLDIPPDKTVYVCNWRCPVCNFYNPTELESMPKDTKVRCLGCGRDSKINPKK